MIPSLRLVLLAVLPLVFGILSIFESGFIVPMLMVDGGLVGLSLVDALLGRGRFIEVQRDLPRVLSVGRDNPVTLFVRSRARRRLVVAIHTDLPESVQSADLPLTLTLPPRTHARVRFHVRPERRGAFTFGAQVIRHPTPLGLWQRQYRCAMADTARVYPDLKAVRTYELLARQNREASMARAVRLRGGENEFERLREYQRDDPYRSIDWRATARRQKLIAREYQKERDQSVIAVLDCGRLMAAEVSGLSQLDHALNATLMLAHVAARSGDHVGLLAFDERVRVFLPPAPGPQATRALIRATYALEPELVETDHLLAFELLSRRVQKRSLIVLFSQVVDELGAARLSRLVHGLPKRHLVLVVLFRDAELDALVDAPLDAPPSPNAPEAYVRGAAAESVAWRDKLARELAAGGALVLHTPPAHMTADLVNRYLEIKARQLL